MTAQPEMVAWNAATGSRLARRLLGNYAFQLVNLGIRLFEQLLLIPLFLTAWGAELYKDWLVLLALVIFLNLCNFGTDLYFGSVFLELAAADDRTALQRQIRIGLFVALTASAAVLAIAFGAFFTINIDQALTLSAMDRSTALFLLVLMTAPMPLWFSMEILRALYRAHGDFSRGECLFAAFNATQIATIAVLLIAHQPPLMVALGSLVLTLVYALGTMLDVRRRYPVASLGIAIPTWRELREIVPRSLLHFVGPLAAALVQSGTLLVFGLLNVGAAATVQYNTLRVFTGLTRQVGAQSFAVGSGIEMARQHVQNELDACRRLYAGTGRVSTGLAGLLAGISIPASAPFVTLWTHGAVPPDRALVAWILAGIFLAAPGQASMMLLRYSNRPRPIALASVAHAAAGLLLCLLLVPQIGVRGAAVAFMVTESLAIGFFQPVVVNALFGFSAARHLLTSYAVGAGAFLLSFAVATPLFELSTLDPLGVLLRGGIWAVVVLPPGALLILPQGRRTQVFALLRRHLPLSG